MTTETPVTPTTETATPPAPPAAPATPAPEVKKEDPLISSRIAALQKEEKRIRAEREALKDVKAQKAELDKALKEAKSNPIVALQKMGLSVDDIINVVLNDGKPTPELKVKALEEKIDSFKQEQEEARLAAEKEKLAQQETLIQNQFAEAKKNTIAAVKAETEKYELVTALGLEEEVWNRIYNHAVETQAAGNTEILTIDQVASEYEKELEAYGEKLIASKKFKAKLSVTEPLDTSSPDPMVAELLDQAKVRGTPKKTLTNNMPPSSTPPATTKRVTEAERRAAALKLVEEAMKAK